MQKSAKSPAPEGPQNSDDDEYHRDEPLGPVRNKQREREEEDEQNKETGRGVVREYCRDRELARPPREEILDRTNPFCRSCRIDFGDRKPFLQHNQLIHQRKLRTKSGVRIPTPSPQRRGQSLPMKPEPEAHGRSRGRQAGRPETAARDQSGGRPTPQGKNSGVFRGRSSEVFCPPGAEDPVARPPRSLQEEVARKSKSTSCWRSPRELPLEDGREEGEIQAVDRGNGAAGGAGPENIREGEVENAPRQETQGRGGPAGKGRRRSETGPPGNSRPPVRGAGEGRKHRRASHGEDKKESPAEWKEVRLEGAPVRPTGRIIRKVLKQAARGASTGRPASPAGQGEAAPVGRPSEEPKPVPGIVLVMAGAASEGSPH